MRRLLGLAIAACFIFSTAVEAKTRHKHHVAYHHVTVHHRTATAAYNRMMAGDGLGIGATMQATVLHGRPSGCPHRYCGCEASLYKFGHIIPDLNLAENWLHRFPRTSPAPGMAAARSGHVMILVSHVSGSDWLVHDGNSGGGLTREHVRSISGYGIVDPNGNAVGSVHHAHYAANVPVQPHGYMDRFGAGI